MRFKFSRRSALCLFIISQLLSSKDLLAQWHSCNVPGGGNITSIVSDGSNLFSSLFYQNGLFTSSNNGVNWSLVGGVGLPSFPYQAGVLSYIGSNLYVGAGNGSTSSVYKSSNGGASFTDIGNGYSIGDASSIAVSNDTIYLGSYTGVLYSSNGGSVWTLVNSGIIYTNIQDVAMFGSKAFAASGGGVYVTTNNGTSWTLTSLHNSINSLFVYGTDIYAAGDGVYKSTNGGSTWTAITKGLPTGFLGNKIIVSNGYLVCCGGSFGVYTTLLSPINWTAKNNGMINTYTKCLTSQGTDLYCGNFESGVFRSVNNGGYWTPVNDGFHSMNIVSMAVDSPTIYAGSGQSGIFRSDDYGVTYSMVDSGLPKNAGAVLAADKNHLFAYLGGQGSYRTSNGGTTWAKITASMGLTDTIVNTFAVKDNYVYAGTYDSGVYVSSDYGLTWKKKDYGLSDANITCLTICDTVVYASSYFLYSPSNTFRSFDHGNTWHIFNNGMASNLYASQLTSGGKFVYIAANDQNYNTDGYIYRTSNDSSNWNLLITPKPDNTFYPYFINAQDSVIFATQDYYGAQSKEYTVHSLNAGKSWFIDTVGTEPETTYCIIVNAQYAFMGTGENSVWCYDYTTPTGIPSVHSFNAITKAYPNPSTGNFYFELTGTGQSELIITNLLGQQVWRRHINAGESNIVADLSGLPKGVYLFSVRNGQESSNGKIIIQ